MKYLVIRYFDSYAEDKYYFKTEEEALDFEKNKNKEVKNRPHTYFEYRGKTGGENND